MAKNDYQNWDKTALIAEINALQKRKKFGLVWEDKPEEVVDRCRRELPVLEEIKSLAVAADSADAPTNLLIEGDNYHALSVLNYTHAGKIDVIYIDPPYNTGARDWKYNNNFVDKNDGYRHSKWLSMMANRLVLAKNLLTRSGFIAIAIDHNELFALGCLCDEIFGEDNRLGVVSVVIKPEGRQFSKFFSVSNDYMLVYAQSVDDASFRTIVLTPEAAAKFDCEDEKGKYQLRRYINYNKLEISSKTVKPSFWYPFYASPDYAHLSLSPKAGYSEIWPVDKGREKTWQTKQETSQARLDSGDLVCRDNKSGEAEIFYKVRPQQRFLTHWTDSRHNATRYGTHLTEKLVNRNGFSYPKSVYTVMDTLKIMAPPSGIILDFFAGTGTTGHAVSLLNKEDGGRRRFILCTNNESGIAREVCRPRIKAVIEGHKDLPDITGVPSNLRFFKTAFVPSRKTPTDQDKIRLTQKAAEMICVKEGTFEPVKETKAYKVFRDGKRHTAVVYDKAAIPAFKKYAAKTDGEFAAYVFSLGDDDFADEFAGMRGKMRVCAIPEAILRVYRRIFGGGRKR